MCGAEVDLSTPGKTHILGEVPEEHLIWVGQPYTSKVSHLSLEVL